MANDVFISYSSKDKKIADAVCATLEQAGIRCWIAPRDVSPGVSYPSALVNAIHGSRLMVLIFSASFNRSPQVMREVERVVSQGKPIIPFRIEDVRPSDDLEFLISAPQWMDAMTPPMEFHIRKLVAAVRALLGDAGGGGTTVEQYSSPASSKTRRMIIGVGVALVVGVLLCYGSSKLLVSALQQAAREQAVQEQAGQDGEERAPIAQQPSAQGSECDGAQTMASLYQTANPELSAEESASHGAFSLLLGRIISSCSRGEESIVIADVRSTLVNRCSIVSDGMFDSMLDSVGPDSDSTEMRLLSPISGRSEMAIDCSAVDTMLGTDFGKQLDEMLRGVGLIESSAESETGSKVESKNDALYTQAADLFGQLEDAMELPAGAERSKIMTTAIKEEWDVQIKENLRTYLAEEPDGQYAQGAQALLEKAEISEALGAMERLRPGLQEIWNQGTP